MTHEGNKDWLRKWLRLEPHQIIGDVASPYLLRWYLLPRNPLLNVYLHCFLRSDEDRALHDHPWWFASLVLKGCYWEHRKDRPITARSLRGPGSLALRRASTAHRVELEPGPGAEAPAWTLIVAGPRVREWGFHCKEWVHWERFVHQNGCGEE